MSIDEIVRAWKDDEDDKDDKEGKNEQTPENPAGQELSDEELKQAAGGINCGDTCGPDYSCAQPTYRI